MSFSDNDAVESLCSLLGADVTAIVGDSYPEPRLLVAGDQQSTSPAVQQKYQLQVEGVTVAEVAGLAAAVLLWGVAFTVFAQPVGRGHRRPVTIFVLHFVLQVQDSAVVPKSCWALAKRLRL